MIAAMDKTQTSRQLTRTEMIELLSALNVTTTLVRLALREGKGVCGAFTVTVDTEGVNDLFTLSIDLTWGA